MKKRIARLLTAFIALAATASLASGIDLTPLTDDQLTALQSELAAEIAARAPAASPDAPLAEGQLGDYHVAVKSARLGEDHKVDPCIIITFEWSHEGPNAESFLTTIGTKLFQGGIQLESAIVLDGMDSTTSLLDIKAGAVLTVERAYVLRDTTSPVELEVSELFDFTRGDTIDVTISLPL